MNDYSQREAIEKEAKRIFINKKSSDIEKLLAADLLIKLQMLERQNA